MSCDVGQRCGLDTALLWLWRRPPATALIRPLAWEPPYVGGAALERQKTKKKKNLMKHAQFQCTIFPFILSVGLFTKPIQLQYLKHNERIPLLWIIASVEILYKREKKTWFKSSDSTYFATYEYYKTESLSNLFLVLLNFMYLVLIVMFLKISCKFCYKC